MATDFLCVDTWIRCVLFNLKKSRLTLKTLINRAFQEISVFWQIL